MSMPIDILSLLSKTKSGYIYRSKIINGIFSQSDKKSMGRRDESIRVMLYRLKKKGFVEKGKKGWKITEEGLAFLFGRRPSYLESHRADKREKNLIIAFDIPENKRAFRWLLRADLVALGFRMIQKSVWHGHAPLPVEFVDRIKKWGIAEHMMFFEAKGADIIGLEKRNTLQRS